MLRINWWNCMSKMRKGFFSCYFNAKFASESHFFFLKLMTFFFFFLVRKHTSGSLLPIVVPTLSLHSSFLPSYTSFLVYLQRVTASLSTSFASEPASENIRSLWGGKTHPDIHIWPPGHSGCGTYLEPSWLIAVFGTLRTGFQVEASDANYAKLYVFICHTPLQSIA